MSDKKRKVPKLRFPGFTDEWEQRKFGDVFQPLQNNSLSRAELNYDSGSVKNIHYGDILIKFGEVLDVNQAELPFISNDEFNIGNTSLIQNGDVIIADAAEDEIVGKCSEIKGINDVKVVSGLHTIPCRPSKEFASGYLGYFMNSHAYHDQLLPLIQGTKISSISKSALQDTHIVFPHNQEEQSEISDYFYNLDNLITLHQRKSENLQKLKKGLLQKMFPKNKECVPELRFPGFTDTWEQRKLGEVAELTSSKRIHAEDYVDSGIPFYRGKEISELRVQKPVSEVLYITEEKYDEITKIYGSPKKNDLLITAVGTLGNTWVVDNLPFYFKDGNLIWFKNISCNSRYLDYALSTSEGQKKIMESAIGSNQKALTMVKLNELKYMFPDEGEQEQIATFFTNLDNLITLHQRKLEHLEELKKGLLQQMFI